MTDPSRILVVEDEALVALGVAMIIEDMGHEVCGPAASVSTALELVGEQRPHLILLDVNLQAGGDGVDVARAVRAADDAPVILFLTSYVDEDTRLRLQQVEPFAVLHKPYDEEELKRAVTRALESASR